LLGAGDTHKALPGAVGSTRIGKRLGFGVPPSAQGFVPIVTAVFSIASIHAKSHEPFETLSWCIAATRSSFFVKNFGWPFCMNGINQSLHRRRSAAAFSESSSLRLFVIEHAQPQAGTDNPD
jgi:hypothetical protein